MITLVLEPKADVKAVKNALVDKGLWVRLLRGQGTVAFIVDPMSKHIDSKELQNLPGVADVLESDSEHPLVDKQVKPVMVSGIPIGHGQPVCLVAGPCSVESKEQIHTVAASLSGHIHILRGGAFKPRTSPYAFQGYGEQALKWLRTAADAYGLRVVTEVLDTVDVDLVAAYADMLQVGARNMYNYALLKQIGRSGKPVLLKRSFSSTLAEWMGAAEYCLLHGASGVIFCERGIRSFDTTTRNVLDLGSVALLSHVRKLPVIVDPSHAVGRKDLIEPLAKAAVAAGASGLMVECHPSPGSAASDGPQALSMPDCIQLLNQIQ